jgi:hypothetical protein
MLGHLPGNFAAFEIQDLAEPQIMPRNDARPSGSAAKSLRAPQLSSPVILRTVDTYGSSKPLNHLPRDRNGWAIHLTSFDA